MKKSFIPNFLTFFNLALGIVSIIMTMEGRTERAALYILAAGIVDRYDGKIARMVGAESALGKELDSLADNVSFGVAPALLIYFMFGVRHWGFWGLLAVISYCICGMFRLARFNSEDFSGKFTGIPITVAGTGLALLALFFRGESIVYTYIITTIMIIFSVLMVSNISIRKR